MDDLNLNGSFHVIFHYPNITAIYMRLFRTWMRCTSSSKASITQELLRRVADIQT